MGNEASKAQKDLNEPLKSTERGLNQQQAVQRLH